MKCLLFLFLLVSTDKILAQGIAVIELFTSQGCSSCPAADKNLSQLIHKAEKEGKQVFGLSFHVDYWNYIGWKDPYSSKEFTNRQQTYAQSLGLSSIYTPQMIVNGRTEFVGANMTVAERSVVTALDQKPLYVITLSGLVISDNHATLNYSLDKSPSGEIVSFAVVEREVENYVSRGENSGKKLHHDNVVRAFKTIPLRQQGSIELELPVIDAEKTSVIVYAQDKQLNVIAAASLSFR